MAKVEGNSVIIITDWNGLKYQIDSRNLNFRFEESASAYEIFAVDGQYIYTTIIYKSGQAPQDQSLHDSWRSDFETNYKNRITDFNSTDPIFLTNTDGYSIVLRNNAVATTGDGYGIGSFGTDGTNYHLIKTDIFGNQIMVGSGVAGTPVGGVLSIQGISGGTPVPISGTITISGGSGTSSNFTSSFPSSGTAVGFTDGSNMQGARVFDADSGAGTQYVLGAILRKSASGGSVELGTSTDPIRIDPTGTTIQPISGTVTANAGTGTFTVSGTVAATQSGTWTVQPGNTANTTPWLTTINQGGNSAAVTASNALKVDGSAVTQPVSGTITANIGTSGSLALDASITAQSVVDNAAFTDGTTRVQPIAFIFDEVAGTALTENDAAAARIDSKRAQINVLEDATTRGTRATIKAASTAAVATDTALVVAISPNNLLSVAGFADTTSSGSLGALNAAVQITTAGLSSVGMQLSSGTLIGTLVPEISYDGGTTWYATYFSDPGTGVLSGNLIFGSSNTAQTKVILSPGGSGLSRVRVSAYTSGTANIIIRASAIGKQVNLFEGAPSLPGPPTVLQIGGSVTTAAPSYTNGNLNPLSLTTAGLLRIDGSGVTQPVSGTVTSNQGTANTLANAWSTKITDATNGPVAVKPASTAPLATDSALVVVLSPNQPAIPITTSPSTSAPNLSNGDIVLSSVVTSAIRRTTYTEQAANFTGSIASANVNDTSAGTGARTVRIFWMNAAGTLAGTEDVTLNGTTGVNLVTSTKCFIEKIEILTAGSGAVNAGIISLYAGANKTGTVVGTIAAGDNTTFWAHHYILSGSVCNVTGIYHGNNSTVSGGTSVAVLKEKDLSSSTSVERQASDFIGVAGASNPFTRIYGSAIQVPGPARLVMYVTTSSSSSITYRGSFDSYDI